MTVTNRFEGSVVRLLAVFATAALLLTLVPTLAGTASADHAHNSNETDRLRMEEEQNRFGTAIDIANRGFPEGSDTVILARADVFADALSGSLVAGQLDAPILLTTGTSLYPATADAITDDMGADTVVLLGGVAAISAATESQVAALEGVENVIRLEGSNRFDTARVIAHYVAGDDQDNVGTTQFEGDDEGQRTAIVATGQAFADALASGPLAYGGTFPLLLTARDFLSGETEEALTDLEIDRVWIAGGAGAVSEAAEAEIQALGIETHRVRVPGGDRTHTAVEFAKLTREVLYTDGDEEDDDRDRHLAVATGFEGNDGVDALALAPLAARFEADLVITRGVTFTDGSAVDGVTQPSTYIHERCHVYGDDATPILLAGGVAAIAPSNEATIQAAALCDVGLGGQLTADPDFDVNVLDPEAEEGQQHSVTVTGEAHTGEAAEDLNVLGELFREADDEQMLALEAYFAARELDEDAPAPFRFYREAVEVEEGEDEEHRYFVLVEDAEDADEPEGQQVLTLGEDGTAVFTYTYDGEAETEDRIVFCAPDALQSVDDDNGDDEEAEEPEEARCTDDSGDLHEDETWAQAVAAKRWVTEDTLTAEFADFVIAGEREVFIDDEGNENPLGAAGGDAEGTATVLTRADAESETGFVVCLSLDVTGVEGSFEAFADASGVSATHIHEGLFNENGPVVLAFSTPEQTDDTGSLTDDCVDAHPALILDIVENPDEYYVNLHTDVWPGGVARGQLDGSWDDEDRTGSPEEE